MKALFLDRDGIINESIVRKNKPYAALTPNECVIIAGVPERLAQLKSLGYVLIVVTNQPDVARGEAKPESVEAVHAKIKAAIPEIDEIKACFHTDEDNCLCRKPKPGLLIEAAFAHHIDLENSFMLGDRWRDVEAGKAAGCTTLFVDYSYDEKLKSEPDHTFNSCTDALDWLLKKGK